MEKIRIYGLKDAFSCMYSFSKETARKQVIDIYASLKVLPRKYLEKDLFSPMHFGQSKKEIRENKINNFKHRINRFTDKITRPFRQIKKETERKDYEFGPLVEYKKNPFELKISTKASDKKRTEDRELEAYIKAKFLINNIEEVDLDQFFYNYAYDDQIINEFFNLLPDNKKSDLCNRFFSILTSNGNYNDYIVKKYIETFKKNISHEDLVELYIYNNLDIENQEIQITDNDIIYYYLKHNGNIPFGYSERFEKIIEKLDFNEITVLLEKASESTDFDIFFLAKKLNSEEYNIVMQNEKISPEVKEKIFRMNIQNLSENEKLSLYKDLTPEKQIKLRNELCFYSKENEEYIKALIENTKDEKYKKMLEIYFAKEKVSLEEIIYYINNSKKYGIEFSTTQIQKFTDSEIAEIYDSVEDERIKAELLDFNRKINTFFDKPTNMTEEEIKEYNSFQPNSVLVNKDSIKKYLLNAKSAICYRTLLYSNEKNNLNFSDVLEILGDFIQRKDSLIEDDYHKLSETQNTLIYLATEKANLREKYSLFEKGFLDKDSLLKYISYDYRDIAIENVFNEISFIESIGDIAVKEAYLRNLNYNLTNKSAQFLSSKKEKENIQAENEKNTNVLNKIYKEKIYDKNTSIQNKYLYLATLLNNYYTNDIKVENKELAYKKSLEIKELFSLINNEAQKQDYNFIFDFEPKYEEGYFRRKF